uniref:BZIP domain-containing protein n=1 Tax=Panagrellus redivivus TaxID=6233 RepID=A0A7E4UZ70_PANRE
MAIDPDGVEGEALCGQFGESLANRDSRAISWLSDIRNDHVNVSVTTYITQKSSGVMDISAALSSLMKPQFPDHATLLALAMKYQGNYGMPMYANMASPKPQSLPTLDIASLLAAATAQHDVDSKQFLNLPPVMESPSTPTPTLQNVNPATTPLTITAAPSSPSQSSTSASSAGSLANHSALSSPNSAGRASTPVFGSYKMKSSRTPTRKPPAPIPAEKKDDAYFERRKKNNDAAKRSRDSRRRKEEYTAARAAFLEQENFQLKTQIENLKTDLTSLRMVLLKGGMSNIALNQTSAITAALNRPPSTENLKCETSDEASS